ncbi:hypothetical protein [Mycolicibacterium sp. YH-1]|uniref:AraC-like ligand-binding domain-containing protein n=1 Tax=Mycolicibacterium sp. YH-1 TaxID=2908837 RepID=UPI00352FEB0C
MSRGGEGVKLDLRRYRKIGVELSLVTLDAEVPLAGSPPRDEYLIIIPVTGCVTVSSRGQLHTLSRANGVVVGPGRPVFFTDWDGASSQLCVRITQAQAQVNSTLSHNLRRPVRDAPEFEFFLDLSKSRTAPLMRALELAVIDSLETDHSAARSPTGRQLAVALARAHVQRNSAQPRHRPGSARPAGDCSTIRLGVRPPIHRRL